MTIYRMTAPDPAEAAVISMLGKGMPADPARVLLIFGVGYTDSEAAKSYATRKGYTVDKVDEIPTEYTEQCARLDAWPYHGIFTNPTIDGTDPNSKYYYPGPDGTTVDVRDILSGALPR